IADYERALNAFREADYKAQQLARAVADAGRALTGNNWQYATVSNLGLPFPSGLGGGDIDGKGLPTGKQLGEALSDWHEKKQAAGEARGARPPGVAAGLPAPPY